MVIMKKKKNTQDKSGENLQYSPPKISEGVHTLGQIHYFFEKDKEVKGGYRFFAKELDKRILL